MIGGEVKNGRDPDTKVAKLSVQAVGLLQKFIALKGKDRENVLGLLRDFTTEGDAYEKREIAKTIVELVYPEIIGDMVLALPSLRSDGKFLKARAEYIGKQIRKYRESANMTQVQLAEASDIPQSHISKLEAGLHSPNEFTLEKIAKALKAKVSDLDYDAE